MNSLNVQCNPTSSKNTALAYILHPYYYNSFAYYKTGKPFLQDTPNLVAVDDPSYIE